VEILERSVMSEVKGNKENTDLDTRTNTHMHVIEVYTYIDEYMMNSCC